MAEVKLKIVPVLDFENFKKEMKTDFAKMQSPFPGKASANNRMTGQADKFKLQSAKTLMKQGLSYERARREGLRKQLALQNEVRRFELSNVKKQGKFINKYGQVVENLKGKTSDRMKAIAAGTSSIIGKITGGIIGGIMQFIQASFQKAMDLFKGQTKVAGRLDKEERNKLDTILRAGQDISFKDSVARQNQLASLARLKADLREGGLGVDNLESLAKMAVKMVETGSVASFEEGVGMIESAIRGDIKDLHGIARQIQGEGHKYTEYHTQEFGEELDMKKRLAEIMRVDKSLDIVKKEVGKLDSSAYRTALKTKSEMDNLVDSAAKVVNKVAEHLLGFIKDPIGKSKEIIGIVTSGIVDGVTSALNAVWEKMQSIFNTLTEKLEGFKNSFKNMFTLSLFKKKKKEDNDTKEHTQALKENTKELKEKNSKTKSSETFKDKTN